MTCSHRRSLLASALAALTALGLLQACVVGNSDDERCVPGPAGSTDVDLSPDAGTSDAAAFVGDAAALADGASCQAICPTHINTFANNVGLASCSFLVDSAGKPVARCMYRCF
jgi:hypothetical protein